MNRRTFLVRSMLGTMMCMLPFTALALPGQQQGSCFVHGVASGDPSQHSAVIWTRITQDAAEPAAVIWEVSETKAFDVVAARGTVTTSSQRDYTVKAEVQGLRPGTRYYYRFRYAERYSPTGCFKTLPDSLDHAFNAAVVSCNNYEDGYFSSFGHIAAHEEVDCVIHLGDYIYEYGTLGYANKDFVAASGRVNEPKHELLTLEDYRKRYALYRRDVHLQELHRNKPFFCIWDDHELANNAYVDGAKNHQPDEGDWNTRKQAALQAYFEWMPVRAATVAEMIRKVDIGKDCRFYFLEERLDGRDRQYPAQDAEVQSEHRRLISEQQQQWLTENLEEASVKWHIIANQVMFTGYDLPSASASQEVDWWTGYPKQRQQLVSVFKKMQHAPVILTGDHHQAHVLELRDPETGKPVALEFLTPSITSRNDDRMQPARREEKAKQLQLYNPHLVYSNTYRHGYYILKITKENLKFDYRYNTDILVPEGTEMQGPVFEVNSKHQLIKHV